MKRPIDVCRLILTAWWRDRALMLSQLQQVVVLLLLVAALPLFLRSNALTDNGRQIRVAVEGSAPATMAATLRSAHLVSIPADDARAAVSRGVADDGLIIDDSRSVTPVERTDSSGSRIAAALIIRRLAGAGVAISDQDLSTSAVGLRRKTKRIVPAWALLQLWPAATLAATFVLSGRRKRTLEPLLVLPVSRRQLVAGLWLAAVVVGAAAMGVFLGAVTFVSETVRVGSMSPLPLTLTAQVWLSQLPGITIAAAAGVLIGFAVRSMERSSMWLLIGTLVPAAIAVTSMATGAPGRGSIVTGLVPVFGSIAIGRSAFGGGLAVGQLAEAFVVCGLVTAGLLALAARDRDLVVLRTQS